MQRSNDTPGPGSATGSATRPTLATLVYCIRDSRVLLLQRRKPPLVGYWVAPGGKIECFESPAECAVRELREETGLHAHDIALRGVVREVSPRADWQWLLFIYLVTGFDGTVQDTCTEGELRWWPMAQVAHARIPDADRAFFDAVVDMTAPVYEARLVYDDELHLREIVATTTGRTA